MVLSAKLQSIALQGSPADWQGAGAPAAVLVPGELLSTSAKNDHAQKRHQPKMLDDRCSTFPVGSLHGAAVWSLGTGREMQCGSLLGRDSTNGITPAFSLHAWSNFLYAGLQQSTAPAMQQSVSPKALSLWQHKASNTEIPVREGTRTSLLWIHRKGEPE